MKVSADGFTFDFTDAVDAFVFDEKDPASPRFHGLSHAMKAVDVVAEFADHYVLVEVKDYRLATRPFANGFLDDVTESLKHKYRDSFLYRWSEKKTDKPMHYVCVLEIETPLLLRMQAEVSRQVPAGKARPRWHRAIAESCIVLNPAAWNRNFPKWPVTCPGGGGAAVAAGAVP